MKYNLLIYKKSQNYEKDKSIFEEQNNVILSTNIEDF